MKPYNAKVWSSNTRVECVASSRMESRSGYFFSLISASDFKSGAGMNQMNIAVPGRVSGENPDRQRLGESPVPR